MNTKVCTKCGIEYPAITEYFHKASKGKYGLFATCKKCKSKLFTESQKQYREKHKEHYKELKRVWNENNKAHTKEYSKSYYENNKSLIKERNKAKRSKWDSKYYSNNYDRVMEFKRKYSKSERGKLFAMKNSQIRRARFRKLKASFTVEQWDKCKSDFNNKCCYCGKEKELTQDHFVPLSKDGEYTINNILPCCLSCNSSKLNKDYFEWYPSQEFYSKKRESKILKYLNYNKKSEIQQLALTI